MPKTDAVFTALGDVDEVNACLGVAIESCLEVFTSETSEKDTTQMEGAATAAGLDGRLLAPQLTELQSRLLDVGSAVATPMDASSQGKLRITAFDPNATRTVEGWMDTMDEQLPSLTQFILPGGGKPAAQLHVARATCRRAERSVVALGCDHVCADVRVFLNRLSDYLFTAARFASAAQGCTETVYKKARGTG
jgi:cob(I)alamin adenosyltransferase